MRKAIAGGFDSETLAQLTAATSRVPVLGTPGTGSPWRFRHRRGRVEIVLAPPASESPEQVDGNMRTTVLAAAAALFNLRLAIGHLGYAPQVEAVCDASPDGILARVGSGRRRAPLPDDERLYAAMMRSQSHATHVGAGKISDEIVDALLAAGHGEGARMVEPTEAESTALDTAMTNQDDVLGYAAMLGAGQTAWLPPWAERPTRSLVIVTPSDDAWSWLVAGQALQAVLLEAACHGLAVRVGVPPDAGAVDRRGLARVLCPGAFPQVALQVGPASHER